MPLYIAQSGDLDRCYRCLTDSQTLKDRATQLLRSRTKALVTQFHCLKIIAVRRGVRSDAQLSCTETRFQKCSQSGKNGSKHPMLSISMAFNVISCKKVKRNTQKLKIADFTM